MHNWDIRRHSKQIIVLFFFAILFPIITSSSLLVLIGPEWVHRLVLRLRWWGSFFLVHLVIIVVEHLLQLPRRRRVCFGTRSHHSFKLCTASSSSYIATHTPPQSAVLASSSPSYIPPVPYRSNLHILLIRRSKDKTISYVTGSLRYTNHKSQKSRRN